jgi:hypothetical protein
VSGAEPDPNPANNVATTATVVKAQPAIAIGNASLVEGGRGTTTSFPLTVSLSLSSTQAVTVQYATANGTAVAGGGGADYVSVGGTLSFAPGVTALTVNVPVVGDTRKEANETFFVNLSAPVNATIADGQGLGTILDDDRN